MDLTGSTIKPTEGRVLVKFVDADDTKPGASMGSPMETSQGQEGVLATVLAVGPKVTGMKKGDVVILYPWACEGLTVGEDTVITDSYSIAAVVD